MHYVEAIEIRDLHRPRERRWWSALSQRESSRWRSGRARPRLRRCGACGEPWPCPPHRLAGLTVLRALRDVLAAGTGRHP